MGRSEGISIHFFWNTLGTMLPGPPTLRVRNFPWLDCNSAPWQSSLLFSTALGFTLPERLDFCHPPWSLPESTLENMPLFMLRRFLSHFLPVKCCWLKGLFISQSHPLLVLAGSLFANTALSKTWIFHVFDFSKLYLTKPYPQFFWGHASHTIL